jgi:hypothetical protein
VGGEMDDGWMDGLMDGYVKGERSTEMNGKLTKVRKST